MTKYLFSLSYQTSGTHPDPVDLLCTSEMKIISKVCAVQTFVWTEMLAKQPKKEKCSNCANSANSVYPGLERF